MAYSFPKFSFLIGVVLIVIISSQLHIRNIPNIPNLQNMSQNIQMTEIKKEPMTFDCGMQCNKFDVKDINELKEEIQNWNYSQQISSNGELQPLEPFMSIKVENENGIINQSPYYEYMGINQQMYPEG